MCAPGRARTPDPQLSTVLLYSKGGGVIHTIPELKGNLADIGLSHVVLGQH